MQQQAWRTRPWVIVGAGRVGRMMGLLGRKLGADVLASWNRDEQGAEETAEMLDVTHAYSGGLDALGELLVNTPDLVVWLTVVDDVLPRIATTLAPWLREDAVVVHTAGSLSSMVLADAGIQAHVASLHPLQAVADPVSGLEMMHQCVWTLEGDAAARSVLAALMGEVEIAPMHIEPEAKVFYHAAAVTSANLLVALVDAAYDMARAAGLSTEQARQMLLPLAHSSLENLWHKTPAEALTGPVARGDAATIAMHEQALEGLSDELLELYQVLTRKAWQLSDDE